MIRRNDDGTTYTVRTTPATVGSLVTAPVADGEHPTVVGAVEIANRLRVARRTVDGWRQRNLGFPAPRWRVGGRPAWDWATVLEWARDTERLTD